MGQNSDVSNSVKTNFYLDLANIIPFIMLIYTGLLLQGEYHMHGQPDWYRVWGLDRSGWLLLHKISAVISLTGITAHCLLHRKVITATVKRIFKSNSRTKVLLSFYLLLVYIPASLTALVAWAMFKNGDSARFLLLEVHDKLTLLLIILAVVHFATRLRWIVNVSRRMFDTGLLKFRERGDIQ